MDAGTAWQRALTGARGAAVEVTRRLKAPVKRVTKYRGSVNVQAVTQTRKVQVALVAASGARYRGLSGHLLRAPDPKSLCLLA